MIIMIKTNVMMMNLIIITAIMLVTRLLLIVVVSQLIVPSVNVMFVVLLDTFISAKIAKGMFTHQLKNRRNSF